MNRTSKVKQFSQGNWSLYSARRGASFLEDAVDLLVSVTQLESRLVCLGVDVVDEFILALQFHIKAFGQSFQTRQPERHLV